MYIRYLEEVTTMSRKLASLSYDEQIISLEWTNTYRELLDTEEKLAGLPLATTPKARAAIEDQVDKLRNRIIEIQEQRDAFQQAIQLIMDRCTLIKDTIKHEKDLEALRLEMTARVKSAINSA
jgi:hypothetical protein